MSSSWFGQHTTLSRGRILTRRVYQIIGDNFYQPVAPDWSGATFSYRLLVDSSTDSGTLDLFAHPPLVRSGAYVAP